MPRLIDEYSMAVVLWLNSLRGSVSSEGEMPGAHRACNKSQ